MYNRENEEQAELSLIPELDTRKFKISGFFEKFLNGRWNKLREGGQNAQGQFAYR